MTLVIERCDYQAAKYAVEKWHYSRSMPVSRSIFYGVWENDRYIGAVIYARGASRNMLEQYGLLKTEGCELTRVALAEHEAPVSQIISATLKVLRLSNPGLRLVVSFADPYYGHHGGIYQAGGWIYLGCTSPTMMYVVNGERVHARQIGALRAHAIKSKTQEARRRAPLTGESTLAWTRRIYGNVEATRSLPKHRYVMPLDKGMRRQLTKLAMPYPRPCGQSLDGETPGPRSGSASSTLADRSI